MRREELRLRLRALVREARLEVGDVCRQVDVLGQRGGEGGVGCGEGGMDCWRGVGYGVEEGWVGENLMEVLFSEQSPLA